MPNPKRKLSKQRKRTRRAHDRLEPVAITTCTNCGAAVRTHRACTECGHYRGRQVLAVKA